MVFGGCAARAAEEDAALSFQVENDLFGEGTDRHYTNGLRISYMFPLQRTPKFARVLRDKVPWLSDAGDLRAVLAWGQNMYTPGDISVAELLPDDRPYAGWLYTELGLVVRKQRSRDTFMINLGVVGPAALARQAQSRWHRVIGSPLPQGWSNQLRNEPALMLIYQHEWINGHQQLGAGLEAELTPHVGIALGNVFTYASAGATLRLGPRLSDDPSVPPRIRPSLPGTANFEVRKGRSDWYVFAGFEGRVVGRNMFLDGNLFHDSHSVDKKRDVWDLQIGAALTLGALNIPARIAYNFVYRSIEFHGQVRADKFGSISISFRY